MGAPGLGVLESQHSKETNVLQRFLHSSVPFRAERRTFLLAESLESSKKGK